MPKFLNTDEVYRLLQRELPDYVYPDGEPSAYYSTADMYSVGDVAATAYGNLERIYENQWPQSADERIFDWEITAFNKNLPSALTLEQRQDRTSQRIRSRKGLTVGDIKDIVLSIIGTDKLVDVIEWGCSTGGWQIGISQLGIETYLNGYPSRLTAVGPDLCGADPADYGYTEEEWQIMREEAYTYSVYIYDYTMTAQEAADVEDDLTLFEPARCQHFVVDGLDSADMLDGDT